MVDININLTDSFPKVADNECMMWCKQQTISFATKELLIIPVIIAIINLVKYLFWIYDFGMSDSKRIELMKAIDFFNIVLVIGYIVQIGLMIK